ncbi:phosphonate monoester hydrolase [Roseovarius faecimaris]|uniref:Phosphonate monoester hydrolase n=1 Tax=Roseovarius faecimaris TaxID=2494550 RepID=A0A6I6IW57_9RHOB|nr:sulfatase-like hydrolase/transferase [Roseovarius faecimaris]QGX99646.1 phosphonate monoester hydrolase [Roseovarius faecimaris]
MQHRRNILFIVIDQLRADCLTGALADHVDMPHLQSLRDEALTFANHYSVCNPCGPSRASMLTGQYAMNHRAVRNGTPLPADTPTLGTELRAAGYLPLLYGYTDSAQDPRGRAPDDPALTSYEEVMPGFHEVVEMRLEQSHPWRAYLAVKGYDVSGFPDIFRAQGPDICDPAMYRAEDSDTAFLTDRFLEDIATRGAGWCAHLTYIRPHPPLVAPAPYNRMYDPATLPAPQPCGDAHPFHTSLVATKPPSCMLDGHPDLPDAPENIAKLRALYLGLTTEVDHHIGRIISWLKESGQYDDTLLIVTADHAELLGDHGAWGKMSYHDAAYHVPLIIRDPHAPDRHGQTETALTESVDLMPTILDLAGHLPPDTVDGTSLAPLLTGPAPAGWRSHTFSELDFGDPLTPTTLQTRLNLPLTEASLAVLRNGAQRLVHFAGGLPSLLLEVDETGQSRDITDQPGAEQAILRLSQAMLDHRMRHAGGRFNHTMITPNGPKNAPRHQKTPDRATRLAQVS